MERAREAAAAACGDAKAPTGATAEAAWTETAAAPPNEAAVVAHAAPVEVTADAEVVGEGTPAEAPPPRAAVTGGEEEVMEGEAAGEGAAQLAAPSDIDGDAGAGRGGGEGEGDQHGGDGDGGGEDGEDGEEGAKRTASDTLVEVSELKASGRRHGQSDDWEAAYDAYADACRLLESCAVEAEASEPEAKQIAAELQACRLHGALCAQQLGRWSDAVDLCGEVLARSPRCAAALYRRALALEAGGQLEAASWDLGQAASLKPSSDKYAAARERVGKAAKAAKPRLDLARPSGSPGGRTGAAEGPPGGLDDLLKSLMGDQTRRNAIGPPMSPQ